MVLDKIIEDGSEMRSPFVAIRLLVLTACRLSEIQERNWLHFDLEIGRQLSTCEPLRA